MILEEEQEVEQQPDPADQDTLVFESEESEEELFNTAVDTTSDYLNYKKMYKSNCAKEMKKEKEILQRESKNLRKHLTL